MFVTLKARKIHLETRLMVVDQYFRERLTSWIHCAIPRTLLSIGAGHLVRPLRMRQSSALASSSLVSRLRSLIRPSPLYSLTRQRRIQIFLTTHVESEHFSSSIT